MSAGQYDREEGFFARWSRVKTHAREAADAPAASAPLSAPASAPAAAAARAEPAPELPPIDELTMDSDFSSFFHPQVDEGVRRSALRKLFSDPHFNVMDGLDVYIDDYSKTEPIPPAMLAGLRQAQRIFEWAAEQQEERAPTAEVQGAGVPELAPASEPSEASGVETPDLARAPKPSA